jgi:hypothetical protein
MALIVENNMNQDTTHLLGIQYLTDAQEYDTGYAVVRDYKEFENSIIANDALGFIEIINIKCHSGYGYQEPTNSCNTETIEILGLSVLYFTVIALGIILLKKFLKK